MTPRDFICTPSSWITEPRLNGLSDDAEALFRRLASCTDQKWRFPFDPSAPEHSIRTAAFSPQRRFRAWNLDRIRRSLRELTAAGMLVRLCQGDRSWLEVAEAYRYVKGRDPLGVEGAPEPQELPLPLFALEKKPPAVAPVSLRVDSTVPENGVRVDSEQSRANDSASTAPPRLQIADGSRAERDNLPEAARRAAPEGAGKWPMESGNRGLSTEETERFARSEEEIKATAMGGRLWMFIGPKQMRVECAQSGARWLQLLRDRAADLEELIEQGSRIQASELPTGESRARFLTKRLADRAPVEKRTA